METPSYGVRSIALRKFISLEVQPFNQLISTRPELAELRL